MSTSVFMCSRVCEMMRNQIYNAKRLFVFTSLNSKDKQLSCPLLLIGPLELRLDCHSCQKRPGLNLRIISNVHTETFQTFKKILSIPV